MFIVHSIHYKYFISLSKLAIWITYPLLIYTLIFGIEINGLKLINSFGFFVAIAFIAASAVLSAELRRKEKEGPGSPGEPNQKSGGSES